VVVVTGKDMVAGVGEMLTVRGVGVEVRVGVGVRVCPAAMAAGRPTARMAIRRKTIAEDRRVRLDSTPPPLANM
jgi:hypothetical protein